MTRRRMSMIDQTRYVAICADELAAFSPAEVQRVAEAVHVHPRRWWTVERIRRLPLAVLDQQELFIRDRTAFDELSARLAGAPLAALVALVAATEVRQG
jgi:hypothetical protein